MTDPAGIAKSSWILLGAVGALTAMGIVASRDGWALPQPQKKPMSIREESVRGTPLGAGRTRTRYFIGGGTRSGK